jgi:CRISPR-associated endonuclease/helicase Cas3
MTYDDFFQKAMGQTDCKPYEYQRRLAEEDWPDLLDIPTGLGKTAAVILAWIYKRKLKPDAPDPGTPRRLVYCLPMRVLVEQTRDCAVTWLDSLGLLGGKPFYDGEGEQRRLVDYNPWKGDYDSQKIRVHLLMGGEVDRDWAIYPEHDAILIGTQDMLLSRALNRGYAAGRARWPMEFGLLSNDCLWVFDEVQLMGAGLVSSAQLAAFQSKLWPPMIPCRFLWMSATIAVESMETRDRQDLGCHIEKVLMLSQQDKSHSRLHAEKLVVIKPKAPRAEDILCKTQSGRLTLAVLNTVTSAQSVFLTVQEEARKSAGKKGRQRRPELCLLHSRFRLCDRKKKVSTLLDFVRQQDQETGAAEGHPGFVLVATQVVEAGLDISASRMWSEMAPWPSCIQRLGRLNREDAQPDAEAVF